MLRANIIKNIDCETFKFIMSAVSGTMSNITDFSVAVMIFELSAYAKEQQISSNEAQKYCIEPAEKIDCLTSEHNDRVSRLYKNAIECLSTLSDDDVRHMVAVILGFCWGIESVADGVPLERQWESMRAFESLP